MSKPHRPSYGFQVKSPEFPKLLKGPKLEKLLVEVGILDEPDDVPFSFGERERREGGGRESKRAG